MNLFIGQSYCKIDEKGRFLFPSRFYALLPGTDKAEPIVKFVSKKVDTLPCHALYPIEVFENLRVTTMSKLNPLINSDMEAMTSFFADVEEISVDKQKRIKIPLSFRNQFGNELVLVGMATFFQIWDKKVFEERNQINAIKGGVLSNKLETIRDIENKKNSNLN